MLEDKFWKFIGYTKLKFGEHRRDQRGGARTEKRDGEHLMKNSRMSRIERETRPRTSHHPQEAAINKCRINRVISNSSHVIWSTSATTRNERGSEKLDNHAMTRPDNEIIAQINFLFCKYLLQCQMIHAMNQSSSKANEEGQQRARGGGDEFSAIFTIFPVRILLTDFHFLQLSTPPSTAGFLPTIGDSPTREVDKCAHNFSYFNDSLSLLHSFFFCSFSNYFHSKTILYPSDVLPGVVGRWEFMDTPPHCHSTSMWGNWAFVRLEGVRDFAKIFYTFYCFSLLVFFVHATHDKEINSSTKCLTDWNLRLHRGSHKLTLVELNFATTNFHYFFPKVLVFSSIIFLIQFFLLHKIYANLQMHRGKNEIKTNFHSFCRFSFRIQKRMKLDWGYFCSVFLIRLRWMVKEKREWTKGDEESNNRRNNELSLYDFHSQFFLYSFMICAGENAEGTTVGGVVCGDDKEVYEDVWVCSCWGWRWCWDFDVKGSWGLFLCFFIAGYYEI